MSSTVDLLTSKVQRAAAQAPFLGRALLLVWHAARPWTLAWLGLLLVQGLLPVATVFLTRGLVDSLVAVVDKLKRRAADFVPQLTADGQLRRFALQQMDGSTSLGEIAQRLLAQFPETVTSYQAALTVAADVAEKDAA